MFLGKFKISQKLYLGFGIIVLIMLVVLGYTYMNFKKESQAVGANLLSYEVTRESDGLLTSLLNMETGARGYAITGKDKFLEPFNMGKVDFELHFKEIKRLVSENQEQSLSLLFSRRHKVYGE